MPPAPAFTLGNVIITRRAALEFDTTLARHEARHSTQYAWCGGVLMLPLYFAAAGVSWLVSGDIGAWNVFERGAGLTATTPPARSPPTALGGSLEAGARQEAVQLAASRSATSRTCRIERHPLPVRRNSPC